MNPPLSLRVADFMLRKIGADGAEAVDIVEAADGRTMALDLMSRALGHLDSDGSIPALIGAQLQTAIDALWTCGSTDQWSIYLH
jgi:hypothetical protein